MRGSGLRALLTALCVAATSLHAETPAPGPEAIQRAVDQVYKSLVRIRVITESPRDGRLEKRRGVGSGTIISAAGDVVTSHRVAGHGRRIVCRMWDGDEVESHLVAADPLSDLAIIRLDLSSRKSKEPLQVAKFGDSDALKIGDTVLAMGCPPMGSRAVTRGLVSNTEHVLPSFLEEEFLENGELIGAAVSLIAHDAVIYPGHNGGPLVNLAGEVVGVNQIGFDSLGYAIPASTVRDVARQLIADGRVQRSWTGIDAQARPLHATIDHGVLVGGVLPGSPAAAAGLKAGDVMLAYDGTAVDALFDRDLLVVSRLMFATPIGKRVEVRIQRDGEELALNLTTQPRPPVLGDPIEFPEWGLVACNLSPLAAVERQRPDADGVLVVSVGRSSQVTDAQPPILEGCILREVAGQPVRSLADLRRATEEALKGATGARPVLVKFERGRNLELTVVKIGRDVAPPAVEPVPRPGLDFEVQSIGEDLAAALGMQGRHGALITRVYAGRSADRAGLKAGDVVVRFDGDAVACERAEDVESFRAEVRRRRIGQSVALEILRAGQSRHVNLTLDADLSTPGRRESYVDDIFDLTVGSLTPSDRVASELPGDLKATMVDSVEGGGWAEIAGVGAGDLILSINGTPATDAATARDLLRKAAGAEPRRATLFLRRGVHTFFAWVEPVRPRGDGSGKAPAAGK